MNIPYQVFHKRVIRLEKEFRQASSIAVQLADYLSLTKVRREIRKHHKPHASSHEIQAIIKKEVELLGFQSEKRGLFSSYPVAALRPDFYRPVGRSGIILEVE